MTIAIFKAIERKMTKGRLSSADKQDIVRRFRGSVNVSRLKTALGFFDDFKIVPAERSRLIKWFAPPASAGNKRRQFISQFDGIVGKDGRAILRKHVNYVGQRIKTMRYPTQRIGACLKLSRYVKYAPAASKFVRSMLKRERYAIVSSRCVGALLKRRTSSAISAAAGALYNPSYTIRNRAAMALTKAQPKSAVVKVLVGIITRPANWSHGRPSPQVSAADILNVIGKPAVPALIKLLGNKSGSVKRLAAKATIGIKDPRLIPALIKGASSTDYNVRLSCLIGLAQFKDARAIPVYGKALASGYPPMIREAITAAGNLGASAKPLAAKLTKLLRFYLPKKRGSHYSSIIIRALGKIGHRGAVSLMVKALKCPHDYMVRREAAVALAKLKAAAAKAALLAALKIEANNLTRNAMADALVRIDPKTVRDPLVRYHVMRTARSRAKYRVIIATALVDSGVEKSVVKGLKDLRDVFQDYDQLTQYGSLRGSTMKTVLAFARRMLSSKARPSAEVLVSLVRVLELFREKTVVVTKYRLIDLGLKYYPVKAAELLKWDKALPKYAKVWKQSLRSRDPNTVARALAMIIASAAKLGKNDYKYIGSHALANSNFKVRRLAACLLVIRKKKCGAAILIRRFNSETDEALLADLMILLTPHAKKKNVLALYDRVKHLSSRPKIAGSAKALLKELDYYRKYHKRIAKKVKDSRKYIKGLRLTGGFVAGFMARHSFSAMQTGGFSFAFMGSLDKGIWLSRDRKNLVTLGAYLMINPFKIHWKKGWYTMAPAVGGLNVEWTKLRGDSDDEFMYKRFGFAFRPGYAVSYTPGRDKKNVDHGPVLSLGFLFYLDNGGSMGPELTTTYLVNRKEMMYALGFRMTFHGLFDYHNNLVSD